MATHWQMLKWFRLCLIGVVGLWCCSGTVAQASLAVQQVKACGIAFEIPLGYKITKPQRSLADGGLPSCEVRLEKKVSSAKPSGECKDRGDDALARPPYAVCDWFENTGYNVGYPSLVVLHTSLANKPPLGPFSANEAGNWQLADAYGNPQQATSLDCQGRSAWQGEATSRAYWQRARDKGKDISYAYARSAETPFALVTLSPEIAIVLAGDVFDLYGDWARFCRGLRLSDRPQDLP